LKSDFGRTVMVLLALAGAGYSADNAARAGSWRRPVAVLSSAVLPGTGQIMLGSAKRGETLLWLDGAAWMAWAGLRWLGSAREADARLDAAREARADLSQTAARYYKALESYDNADEYNEEVRADARARFPDNPAAQHAYLDSVGYFGTAAWNWSSDSARISYWQTRRSGRTAVQAAGFVVAGLVLNRLASVIDCAFFVREPGGASRVEIVPTADRLGLQLSYHF
jgi:hypothetical protein